MILSDDQLVWCKAVLLFAVTRWLLSIVMNRFNLNPTSITSSDSCRSSTDKSSQSSCSSLRTMKKNVSVTTLQMIEHKLLTDDTNNEVTCAVCLDKLKKNSKVYDLGNCCHVFHKQCLERWISYDERLTCPLCRAFLVRDAQQEEPEQASWAVEKMMYLFGDDLMIQ